MKIVYYEEKSKREDKEKETVAARNCGISLIEDSRDAGSRIEGWRKIDTAVLILKYNGKEYGNDDHCRYLSSETIMISQW